MRKGHPVTYIVFIFHTFYGDPESTSHNYANGFPLSDLICKSRVCIMYFQEDARFVQNIMLLSLR